ncbi:MAG: glutamyl-tRNA reductase [Ktedonobacteraceae bacterium]
MHIVVVGVDHTTASIALRERLTCSSRQIPQVLGATKEIVQECVLLSTCNRMELYAVCSDIHPEREHLLHILSEAKEVSHAELEAHCYTYVDEQAVSHLLGVACGLYSLVPGEPQIQGQVAEAVEIAQGGGFAGPIISALFRAALVTGKRARSETGISRNAASISHVAVQLARHLFPDLHTAHVLLVGSGQMSEVAARNLLDNGAQQLVIINRTHANAIDLAETLGATHRTFAELSDALLDADVVISSTKAPRALITPERMHPILEKRGGRSLLLIDIAMPRDIDPGVGTLPNVHLYNLDDLQSQVERGISLRLQEVEHVRAIIAEEVGVFERWLSSLSVTGTISDLRHHVETLRQQELARAMRQLAPTLSEREAAAVQELTTRLVNKILHTPTLRLKEAAADGQGYVYAEALRYLFNVEENYEANNDRNASQQARHDPNTMGSRAITSAVVQP